MKSFRDLYYAGRNYLYLCGAVMVVAFILIYVLKIELPEFLKIVLVFTCSALWTCGIIGVVWGVMFGGSERTKCKEVLNKEPIETA
jgi:hypothetical protein